jgi:hypothetical protein
MRHARIRVHTAGYVQYFVRQPARAPFVAPRAVETNEDAETPTVQPR